MREWTSSQRKVIEHRGRPMVVVAGPGTGKTSTLVERMVGLIRERSREQVSFVTFTRTSRRDTAQKLDRELEDVGEAEAETRTATVHGAAKHLVSQYCDSVGRRNRFSVMTDSHGEKATVLADLLAHVDVELTVDELSQAIAFHRAHDSWPEEFSACGQLGVMGAFQELLACYDTFDMEGLVSCARRILRSGIATSPIHLQVDEYQDLNPADQDFIGLAASHPDSQVVVAGDDTQSIYSGRHANWRGLHDLWESDAWDNERFADCHRLPAHILNAALDLVAGKGYLGAEMSPKPNDGKRIPVYQCTRSEYQIPVVGMCIDAIRQSRLSRGETLAYSDFMVLCPTRRWARYATRRLLEECDIPTKEVRRGEVPNDHWDLLLVLRMLAHKDSLAFRQWLPRCGVPESLIATLRASALDAGVSLYDSCLGSPDKRVRQLLEAIRVLAEATGDTQQFQRALLAFPGLAVDQDLFPGVGLTVEEGTREGVSPRALVAHIYRRFGIIDPETDIPPEDKVLVTTMHSAKGLEAEYVFLMWMNGTYVPGDGDPEEARRILYVALTRAKRRVIATFHEQWQEGGPYAREEAMTPLLRGIRSHLRIERLGVTELRRAQAREA